MRYGIAAPDVQAEAVDGMRKRLAKPLDDPELPARYRTAMDGQAVDRLVPSLPFGSGVHLLPQGARGGRQPFLVSAWGGWGRAFPRRAKQAR
ncbi:hypothetical protein [Streptomyces caniscabiei]|uniref:Uncharacterized protein n=1 Tax=Streptomyces caniscabiei TaxID=2746961 RepID=A0A927QRY9_9ACTN|nr:hypothetical protein [Streptomyces caniscabiei]MBD9729989.1 hypothetical protein [Streptomyces caniscabiei]MDX3515747.1 hypothetical protein [Streptomyces caniscabiei]MDX3724942.1 hypothetical protein [Streptomyces caniscabiei]WEO29771.1 hypothetical protein IHE65_45120 [Streptomyces caniscabiei]